MFEVIAQLLVVIVIFLNALIKKEILKDAVLGVLACLVIANILTYPLGSFVGASPLLMTLIIITIVIFKLVSKDELSLENTIFLISIFSLNSFLVISTLLMFTYFKKINSQKTIISLLGLLILNFTEFNQLPLLIPVSIVGLILLLVRALEGENLKYSDKVVYLSGFSLLIANVNLEISTLGFLFILALVSILIIISVKSKYLITHQVALTFALGVAFGEVPFTWFVVISFISGFIPIGNNLKYNKYISVFRLSVLILFIISIPFSSKFVPLLYLGAVIVSFVKSIPRKTECRVQRYERIIEFTLVLIMIFVSSKEII